MKKVPKKKEAKKEAKIVVNAYLTMKQATMLKKFAKLSGAKSRSEALRECIEHTYRTKFA